MSMMSQPVEWFSLHSHSRPPAQLKVDSKVGTYRAELSEGRVWRYEFSTASGKQLFVSVQDSDFVVYDRLPIDPKTRRFLDKKELLARLDK